MAEVKCHFDGTIIVVDEPFPLPLNKPMILIVDDAAESSVSTTVKPKRVWGQFEGMGWMSDDFNDPLPDAFWDGKE